MEEAHGHKSDHDTGKGPGRDGCESKRPINGKSLNVRVEWGDTGPTGTSRLDEWQFSRGEGGRGGENSTRSPARALSFLQGIFILGVPSCAGETDRELKSSCIWNAKYLNFIL